MVLITSPLASTFNHEMVLRWMLTLGYQADRPDVRASVAGTAIATRKVYAQEDR